MTEPVAPSVAPRPVAVAPAAPVSPANRAIIEIDDVDFNYGASRALHDITLNIQERQVTAFIGPSGCGKSTLLRCLNRMNDLIDGARVTAGSIKIHGVDIHRPDVDVRLDVEVDLPEPGARAFWRRARRCGWHRTAAA